MVITVNSFVVTSDISPVLCNLDMMVLNCCVLILSCFLRPLSLSANSFMEMTNEPRRTVNPL